MSIQQTKYDLGEQISVNESKEIGQAILCALCLITISTRSDFVSFI